jgi:hypothetical protein
VPVKLGCLASLPVLSFTVVSEPERLLDSQRLEDLLVQRVRSLFPDIPIDGRGLVPELAASWHPDDELSEAVAFLCERYLDVLQDDIMEETTEKWPRTQSGAIPSVEVLVDLAMKQVHLGYVTDTERFDLGSVSFDEVV